MKVAMILNELVKASAKGRAASNKVQNLPKSTVMITPNTSSQACRLIGKIEMDKVGCLRRLLHEAQP